jgi:hypothetical protein
LGCEFSFPLNLDSVFDVCSLLFAVLVWYLAFVAIPKWKGYRVEEEVEVLSDGTSISRLINVKNDVIEGT